jgi:hypothetical protein
LRYLSYAAIFQPFARRVCIVTGLLSAGAICFTLLRRIGGSILNCGNFPAAASVPLTSELLDRE